MPGLEKFLNPVPTGAGNGERQLQGTFDEIDRLVAVVRKLAASRPH